MSIARFVQFIPPNGRQESVEIDLEADLDSKLELINKCGCRLTAEVLMNGICSFCIEHEEGDFEITICKNGPDVPVKITAMIESFTIEKFNEWKSLM